MKMPLIKMEQPPHDLEQMKYYGKISPKLFQLPIPESISSVNHIGIERRLKIMHYHFKPTDFDFVNDLRNNGKNFFGTIRIIKPVRIKITGDIIAPVMDEKDWEVLKD